MAREFAEERTACRIDTNAENEQEPRLITETGLDRRLADIIEPVLVGMGFRLTRVRMPSARTAPPCRSWLSATTAR